MTDNSSEIERNFLRKLEDPRDYQVVPFIEKPASTIENESSGKIVLEEEEYLDSLGNIISKDFFPLVYSDRVSKGLVKDDISLSLKEFTDKYTSEDNESFSKIHHRDIQEHRRKFAWAYPINDGTKTNRKEGMLSLYYMGDKIYTAEEREKFDLLLQSEKTVGDERPNGVNNWNFRVRNQLMFYPDLKDSDQTCKVERNLLTDGTMDTKSSKHYILKKEIVHRNTHIEDTSSQGDCIRFEQPHTPSTFSEASSSRDNVSEINDAKKSHAVVDMTPKIYPGESPLMTWGDVVQTPQVLSSSRDDEPLSVPRFSIQQSSKRELLARSLDSKIKKKPKISSNSYPATATGTPMSFISNKVSYMPGRSAVSRSSKHSNAKSFSQATKNLANQVLQSRCAEVEPYGGKL